MAVATMKIFGRVNFAPYVLVLSKKGRFKTVEEMRGQKVRVGGTTSALMQAELFCGTIGATSVYVNFGGLPEVMMATMRGDVDCTFANWDSAIEHLKASDGALFPVLAAAKERLKAFPDLPTAEELGIKLEDGLLGVMASQSVVLGSGFLS